MNRRTWIAATCATVFVARLRDAAHFRAQTSVDFSNDAVWSDLVTPSYAAAARATPFDPDAVVGGAAPETTLVTSMAVPEMD